MSFLTALCEHLTKSITPIISADFAEFDGVTGRKKRQKSGKIGDFEAKTMKNTAIWGIAVSFGEGIFVTYGGPSKIQNSP